MRSSLLAPGGFWTAPWRSFGILGVVLLAVPTGLVAVSEGAGALPLPFNLYLVDQALPVIFRLHMLASGAVLLLIPAVIALRQRPRWHRPLGRLTAVFVILGALSSFPVALESTSPALARLGFLAQGVVWLALLVQAVRAVRARQILTHQRLMLAMAAVSSGAIWTRLATAVITRCDLPFDPLYSAAAWVGWLVPMALVFAYSAKPRPRALA